MLKLNDKVIVIKKIDPAYEWTVWTESMDRTLGSIGIIKEIKQGWYYVYLGITSDNGWWYPKGSIVPVENINLKYLL